MTATSRHQPDDLRRWPPSTFLPLYGMEKVTAERLASVAASGLAMSASARTLSHSIVTGRSCLFRPTWKTMLTIWLAVCASPVGSSGCRRQLDRHSEPGRVRAGLRGQPAIW